MSQPGRGGARRAALRARPPVPLQRGLPDGRRAGARSRALEKGLASSRTTRSSATNLKRLPSSARRRPRAVTTRAPGLTRDTPLALRRRSACSCRLRARRLPHDLRRRQRRAGHRGRTCWASRTRRATRCTCCWASCGRCWCPLGSIAFRMSLFSAACGAAGLRRALLRCAAAGARRARPRPLAALLAGLRAELLGRGQRAARVRAERALRGAGHRRRLRWHRTPRRPRALVARRSSCAAWAPPTTRSWPSAPSRSALFAVATDRRVLLRARTLAGRGRRRVRGRPAALPLSADPLAAGSRPRLGQPRDARGLLARRDAAGLLGARAASRARRTSCPSRPTTCAASARSSAWAGALLAAAWAWSSAMRRRRWPVLLPLLVMVANLAALALHGSRSDIFIWHRYYIPSYLMAGAAGGHGRARAARARCRARAAACCCWPCRWSLLVLRLPATTTAAATASPRTSAARCSRRCRPARTWSPATTTSSSS